MRLWLFVIISFFSFSLSAFQDEKQSLLDKAEAFQYTNPDSTFYLAQRLFELANENQDSIYLGESRRLLGAYYQLRGQLDSAIFYYNQTLDFYEHTQDLRRLTRAVLSLAICEITIGDYENALIRLKRAEDLATKGEIETYRFRIMGEIARVYSMQGDREKALAQARAFYQEVKDGEEKQDISIALSYLSVEFMYKKMHDSSLYYLNKTIEVENSKITPNPIGLGSAYQNMASVYTEMGDEDLSFQNYQEALEYYAKALYPVGLIQVNLNLAIMNLARGSDDAALTQINDALFQAKNYPDKRLLREIYKVKSEVHSQRNELQEALESYKNFKSTNDSIFTIERQNSIDELITQYEVAQKEQKIETQEAQLLAQEVRVQRNQIFVFSLIVIVLLLVIVFILWKNRSEKALALERQESQLKLRQAEINAVINSQEGERNRFAKDLHDGFGQLISVLKLSLGDVKKVDMKDPEKRLEIYKNGESIINEMYQELRNICFDLMPQTLVKRGLTPALKEFGSKLNQTNQLTCEVLIFSNSPRLKDLFEISLFRITQEWVNNILKYAEASKITIQLTKEDVELTLTVEDNGNGFEVEQFFSGNGNGWKNIQSRLNLINGEFDLDSRPGVQGTMMTVNVPLNQRDYLPTSTEKEVTLG